MTTGVSVARSDQTGMTWGTLSGTAGDLTTLLDKILVNGSNTIAVTAVTRVGNVATYTSAAHGMTATQPDSMRRVTVAGFDQADYNVTGVATFVDSTHFSMIVANNPTTPGTISVAATAKHPGLGWTIAYTGTNKRAYRAPGGLQHYCRVEDAGTGSAAYARITTYVTMSDVDTGTEATPTGGGYYIHKSSAASATVRAWFFAGDTRRFYFLSDFDGTANLSNAIGGGWGELITYRTGDGFHTFNMFASSTVTAQGNVLFSLGASMTVGHQFPRSYTQVAGPVAFTKEFAISRPQAASAKWDMGGSSFANTYPNIMNGGLDLLRLYAYQGYYRGEFPGIWAPNHNRPLANYDTWNGVGALAGRQFMMVYGGVSEANNSTGCIAVEVSDTWDV